MRLKDNEKKNLIIAAAFFAAFILFTVLVKIVDVKPIGPEGSEVGFAALNAVFQAESVRKFWYYLAELTGYIAILVCIFFALIGVKQLIERRSLFAVDARIILLGLFYILVIVFYVIFNKVVINYRPLIVDAEEGLEASYPSSHTVLAMCVFITAVGNLEHYFAGRPDIVKYGKIALYALTVLTVAARPLSGVHWFTDIIGAVIVSLGFIRLYSSALQIFSADYKGKH